MIIASCGHTVNKSVSYSVLDKSRDNKNVVKYTTLCPKCATEYAANGMISESRAQEQQWLGLEDDQ